MSNSSVKINMLSSENRSGDLQVSEGSLRIIPDDKAPNGKMRGYVDSTTGTLTIDIPNHGKIEVSGFLTRDDIGRGAEGSRGNQGNQGTDGAIGLDGEKGNQGPRGEVGDRGVPGVRGPRGKQGNVGKQGPSGGRGIKGDDAMINMFIQEADPGAPGAGAVWVKPIYEHLNANLSEIQAVCEDDEEPIVDDPNLPEIPITVIEQEEVVVPEEGAVAGGDPDPSPDVNEYPYTSVGMAAGEILAGFVVDQLEPAMVNGEASDDTFGLIEEDRFNVQVQLAKPLPVAIEFQVHVGYNAEDMTWHGMRWDDNIELNAREPRTFTIPAGSLVSEQRTAFVPQGWVNEDTQYGYGHFMLHYGPNAKVNTIIEDKPYTLIGGVDRSDNTLYVATPTFRVLPKV